MAVVFASASFMGLFCSGFGAAAQSSEREVLLGVSRLGVAQPARAADRDATQAYEEALVLQRAGSTRAAQRQFEQLVANYPDSAVADRARRELALLYGDERDDVPRPQAALSTGGGSYLGARDLPPVSTGPVGMGRWRTETHPIRKGTFRSVQDEFRTAAGDMVFFSDGSADLGTRARKVLAAQADWLKKHLDRVAVVEGHADDTSSGVDSKAISAARAEAVRRRLIEEGVAASRITVLAHGDSKRVALCNDDSCASQNRRAATSIGANAMADQVPR